MPCGSSSLEIRTARSSRCVRPSQDLPGHEVTFADVVDDPTWQPTTPSERRLARVPRQPAPRSSRPSMAMTCSSSRRRRSATRSSTSAPRCGSSASLAAGRSTSTSTAATARGIPVVTTPGKNATAVAELTIAAMVMIARHVPAALRARARRRRAVHGQLRRRALVRSRARWAHAGPGRLRAGRVAASRAARWRSRCASSRTTRSSTPRRSASTAAEPVDLDTLLDVVGLRLPARTGDRRRTGACSGPSAVRAHAARAPTSSTPPATCSSTRPRSRTPSPPAASAGRPRRREPDAATASPTRSSASRTSSSCPHIGGATFETLANGGRMAAAEIERFAVGPAARQRREPRRPRRGGHAAMTATPHAGDRPRNRQLPGDRVRRRRVASAAPASASGRTPRSRARPARRSSTRPATGRSSATASARRSRRAASRQATSPRSRARACARAWSCTTRPAARSGPARTSTPAPRPRPTTLVRAGHARRIFELGGDWVSITSPARFLWIREHEPEIVRGDRPRRDAQRLGPDEADRPVRDRSVVRLELRTSSTCEPEPGRLSRSRSSACRRMSCPRCSSPARSWARSPRRPRPRPASRPGRPSSSGAPTRSSGSSASGSSRPGTMTLLGGSFWQLTLVTDQPLIDPVGARADAVPRAARPVDDRGHRLLLRHRHALAPRRAVRARAGGGGAARASTRTRSWSAPPRKCPPGSNGLLAIFSNVMDVKRWVQARAVVRRLRRGRPDADRPARLHPCRRGAGRLRDARPPRASSRS